MPFRSPRQRAEARSLLRARLALEQEPPPPGAVATIERLLAAVAAGERGGERGVDPSLGLQTLPRETRQAALVLLLMGEPDGIDAWLDLFRPSTPGAPVSLAIRRRRERAVELALYIEALPSELRRSATSWLRVLRAGRVPLLRRIRHRPPAGRVVDFPADPLTRGPEPDDEALRDEAPDEFVAAETPPRRRTGGGVGGGRG